MVPLLLPWAPTGLASIAARGGRGTPPRGQPRGHLPARCRTSATGCACGAGEVLSVWQVLQGTPSAPRISAQRVARFDDRCTHNLFINNKLPQGYSRSKRDYENEAQCDSNLSPSPLLKHYRYKISASWRSRCRRWRSSCPPRNHAARSSPWSSKGRIRPCTSVGYGSSMSTVASSAAAS
jgi:hypothetical protein